jgi:hypothetical protein
VTFRDTCGRPDGEIVTKFNVRLECAARGATGAILSRRSCHHARLATRPVSRLQMTSRGQVSKTLLPDGVEASLRTSTLEPLPSQVSPSVPSQNSRLNPAFTSRPRWMLLTRP